MKEETKEIFAFIGALIIFGIAGYIMYSIGISLEYKTEYAWLGFAIWGIGFGMMIVFGFIPMIYYWKHPEKKIIKPCNGR